MVEQHSMTEADVSGVSEAMIFHHNFVDVQQSFKSTKNKRNDFGNYQYRNVEAMLQDLKPLLKPYNFSVSFDDEVILIGERYYVKATAFITDGFNTKAASAYAREDEHKKGMDVAQVTGASSTYARKYALAGLLGVDDGTNDPDSKDNSKSAGKATQSGGMRLATAKQIEWINNTAAREFDLDNQEDIDEAVKSILTMPASKVPMSKVKDAVDKITKEGEQMRNDAAKAHTTALTPSDIANLEGSLSIDDMPC